MATQPEPELFENATDAPERPSPFSVGLDALAREQGGWANGQMVYAVEVIGRGEDPQVMLTGGFGEWLPKAKRWAFKGPEKVQAVVRLSEYRLALGVA